MTRCAIYTRKSSDERLDGAYSSLDNQRAYCSAYVASQGGNGWAEMPDHYDDGGFSGGNLNRPALRRLRADIATGAVDAVIIYKIDRLSRSLRDFANLVAEFDSHGVALVSVTQAFDTSTSMGRLTLNVLLSFAQFERELTGERLKDWFAGARNKGLWVPKRPFGYAKKDGNQLVPHPDEAPVVRRIYKRYCAVGSCKRVADELWAAGIRGTDGRPWSASMVLHTLKHPVYRGYIVHRRQPLPGSHEPIVSETLWRRVQEAMENSAWHKRTKQHSPVPALLSGLLYDRVGMRIHHTFLRSKGRLYRYYVAGGEFRRYGSDSDPYMRFAAEPLEQAALAIVDRMAGIRRPPDARHRSEIEGLVRRHVERIDIDENEMRITFRTGAVVHCAAAGRLGPRRRLNRPPR